MSSSIYYNKDYGYLYNNSINNFQRNKNIDINTNKYITFNNPLGENACYINVVLQLFCHINELSSYLKNFQIKNNNNLTTFPTPTKSNSSLPNSKSNHKNMTTPTPTSNIYASNTFSSNESTTTTPSSGDDINNLLQSLSEIINKYINYKNDKFSHNNLHVIDSETFRINLHIASNALFPLETAADPVELIIYLLNNINTFNSQLIHDLFYIDIIKTGTCVKCKKKKTFKFDKDNFFYQIYIEDILNYVEINNYNFDYFYSQIFFIQKQINYQNIIKCENCKQFINTNYIINNNFPKFFLVNFVWNQNKPDIKKIFKIYLMLQSYINFCNLFDIENNQKYIFYGMILYSFHLYHYIICLYDKEKSNFIIYNDKNYKILYSYFDVISDLINDKNIFYPVCLIYKKDENNNKNIYNSFNINEEKYNYLMKKIDYIIKINLNNEEKINDTNNNPVNDTNIENKKTILEDNETPKEKTNFNNNNNDNIKNNENIKQNDYLNQLENYDIYYDEIKKNDILNNNLINESYKNKDINNNKLKKSDLNNNNLINQNYKNKDVDNNELKKNEKKYKFTSNNNNFMKNNNNDKNMNQIKTNDSLDKKINNLSEVSNKLISRNNVIDQNIYKEYLENFNVKGLIETNIKLLKENNDLKKENKELKRMNNNKKIINYTKINNNNSVQMNSKKQKTNIINDRNSIGNINLNKTKTNTYYTNMYIKRK